MPYIMTKDLLQDVYLNIYKSINGIIQNKYSTLANRCYNLELLETYSKYKKEIKEYNPRQYDIVEKFINRTSIKVNNGNVYRDFHVKINSTAFINDYNNLQKSAVSLGKTEEILYIKAYSNAMLGDYENAYTLYSELISKSVEHSVNPILYYFSQINKNYLYVLIKNTKANTTGFRGYLYFCRELDIYSSEFLNAIEDDPKYIRPVSYPFDELPADIRRKYPFLREYSESNCFKEELSDLVRKNWNAEISLNKDYIQTGLSTYDSIKLEMLEKMKLIYENGIVFDRFQECKDYVMAAMNIWLKSYQDDLRKADENKENKGNERKRLCGNTILKFTLQDIILISKFYGLESWRYLYSNIDFEKIPFSEKAGLRKYVKKMLSIYNTYYGGDGHPIKKNQMVLHRSFLEELTILLDIASYYLRNDSTNLSVKNQVGKESVAILMNIIIGNNNNLYIAEALKHWFNPKDKKRIAEINKWYLMHNINIKL